MTVESKFLVASKRTVGGKTQWRGRIYIWDPAAGRITEKTKSGFRTKNEAEEWERSGRKKYRQQKKRGTSRITLASYLTQQRIEDILYGLSQGTAENYRTHIRRRIIPTLGSRYIDAVTDVQIENAQIVWKTRSGKPLSSTVISGTRNALSRIMKAAIRDGYLSENPVVNARRLKDDPRNVSEQTLSPLDAERLIEIFSKRIENPSVLLFIHIALETGMRAGEIEALQRRDVHIDARTISVDRAYSGHSPRTLQTPKSGKGRTVPISRKLLCAIRDAGVTVDRTGNPLLTQPNGERLTHIAVVRNSIVNWKDTLEKLCYPDFRFHDLRATAVVRWLRAGVPLQTVQSWAGHADLKTTQRYVRMAGTDHQLGIDLLDAAERRR